VVRGSAETPSLFDIGLEFDEHPSDMIGDVCEVLPFGYRNQSKAARNIQLANQFAR
jgi:hypothetical protein